MENVVVAINAIWRRGYAFHPAAAAAAATIFQLILLRANSKRLQEVLFTGGFWAIIDFFGWDFWWRNRHVQHLHTMLL